MTFLASLTSGAAVLVRTVGQRLAGGGRTRGDDPDPSVGRPRYRSRHCQSRRDRPHHPGHQRGAALFQGGDRAPARALARHRASARRSAGAAHYRGAHRAAQPCPTSRSCARRSPPRCPRPVSTTIAASSRRCGPWRGRRSWSAAGVLALVLTATVLSVTFATRAAMATNRPVIEVLHLIGAKNSFIAEHFQRHFLRAWTEGRRGRRWRAPSSCSCSPNS